MCIYINTNCKPHQFEYLTVLLPVIQCACELMLNAKDNDSPLGILTTWEFLTPFIAMALWAMATKRLDHRLLRQ